MRFLVVNTDYWDFLRTHYQRNPALASASYREQLTARNDSLFGVADFYSRNLTALGYPAMDVHVNNRWIQFAWAREHGLDVEPPPPPRGGFYRTICKAGGRVLTGFRSLRPAAETQFSGMSNWELRILKAQIEDFKPDVILNQDIYYLRSDIWWKLKGGAVLVGQNAAVLPQGEGYGAYDLMISSLPRHVEHFRRHGCRAELNLLAFEPSVRDRLGPPPPRDLEVTFVGGLSPHHQERIRFLEEVARQVPLKIWGSGQDLLPRSSPLRAIHQGEAWGREMFTILRRSRITLNKHIDVADNAANNMRLYEATGMGALLLTDWKPNLCQIFVPEEQVMAYSSTQDCIEKIRMLLDNENRRQAIAAAGQKHAIETHNFRIRMTELVNLIESLHLTQSLSASS